MTTSPRIHTALTAYRSLRWWQILPPFNSSSTKADHQTHPRRSLNHFARLLGVAIVAAHSWAVHAAEVREYEVSVPGVTSKVMIRVPEAFRLAANDAEAAGRKTLLDNLQTNSKGKAGVSEAFSTDWTHPATPPILFVGTLPGYESRQGKIPSGYWSQLKEMMVEKANLSSAQARQQMLAHGLPDPGGTMSRTMDTTDANSLIFFGLAPPVGKPSAGAPALILLARKLKYVRNCIVMFEASVDASAPDAMAKLDEIIRTVDAP